MEWVNIYAPTLRAPEYIGSEPTARATWFNVLSYCCEQENGGRIVGGARWKDRQWQQTCGVTLKEINSADPLLTIDGDDVIVWKYPIEKEIEVQRFRAMGRSTSERKASAARQNGNRGGRPKTQLETERETQPQEPTGANPGTQPNPRKPIEWNGREEEGNGREASGVGIPTANQFIDRLAGEIVDLGLPLPLRNYLESRYSDYKTRGWQMGNSPIRDWTAIGPKLAVQYRSDHAEWVSKRRGMSGNGTPGTKGNGYL